LAIPVVVGNIVVVFGRKVEEELDPTTVVFGLKVVELIEDLVALVIATVVFPSCSVVEASSKAIVTVASGGSVLFSVSVRCFG
jgi:hypothetical protein